MQYNSRVTKAIWDEDSGTWKVKIQQGDKTIEDTCDVLINGSGVLNAWSWPNIPGLHDFKGHLCHSADWRAGYDFAGKRVAVIGNGSSAIQIVPELAKVASKLHNIVPAAASACPDCPLEQLVAPDVPVILHFGLDIKCSDHH